MTLKTQDRPEPGDIVSFQFPYREGPAPSARPCLVVDADEDEILIAYGTTKMTNANHGLELHVLNDLGASGLHRPTRFVAARRIRVRRDDVRLSGNKDGQVIIGQLGPETRQRLSEIQEALRADSAGEGGMARERDGIHPGPKRSFLRSRGRGQRSAQATTEVIVVTRGRRGKPAPTRHV